MTNTLEIHYSSLQLKMNSCVIIDKDVPLVDVMLTFYMMISDES